MLNKYDEQLEMQMIAERLKEAISKSGIKKTDIATACGVSDQAVTGWLKTGRVHKKHVPKLAALTGVSTDWLLTGKESTKLSLSTTLSYDLLEDNAELVGASNEPILHSDEAMLLRLFREMTDEQRADILKNASDTHETNERLLAQLLARKKA
jgi:transcriptional regulator with XRE-family HTH domain